MNADPATLADVVAIPVTPFRDGAVDVAGYRQVLRRLVDAGVGVVTPNGNTSEFYALTPAERAELIAAAGAYADRAQLVVGVGHDVESAVADGELARAAGARFVMVHQPAHPHVSRAGWLDYYRQIAGRLPELGIVLYIRSAMVDAELLDELADAAPNVVAVKYAVADVALFARIRQRVRNGSLVWLAGLAEPYALAYAVHGAEGFTSGLVNVNPQLSLALRDALRQGESAAAAALIARIDRFEELRALNASANNVSVVKEALAQLGVCSREVRAPSATLSEPDRRAVAEVLAGWAADFDLAAVPVPAPAQR